MIKTPEINLTLFLERKNFIFKRITPLPDDLLGPICWREKFKFLPFPIFDLLHMQLICMLQYKWTAVYMKQPFPQ